MACLRATFATRAKAIYAVLSGYGTDGPDSDRQAFDQTAFWAAMSAFGIAMTAH